MLDPVIFSALVSGLGGLAIVLACCVVAAAFNPR